MGGKALKNTFTERKNTAEYKEIESKLVPIFKKDLGTTVYVVESYLEKATHGDMDIMIMFTQELYDKNFNLYKYIKDTFNPNDIINNGGVISFDYDEFQIDIIPINENIWKPAIAFFSFDPSGNLFGKIAHHFGLKYGWNGLYYPFRNFNGRLSKNILISTDNHEIFNFLGYDFDRYKEGFTTLIEIFDYIIDGKYFNNKTFLMENLNAIDRKRNLKRKTYQQFLQYVENNSVESNYEFKKDKSAYLDLIDDTFPKAKLKWNISELKRLDDENKELNAKFNGKTIMAKYPTLKGKELGNTITKFRDSLGDFKEYALSHTSEEIMEAFSVFYSEYK